MDKSETEFVEGGNRFYINNIAGRRKGGGKKMLSKQTFLIL